MTQIKKATWSSWNHNIQHTYNNCFTVQSEEEISEIVQNATSVRVFGSKQSSADIAAGTETLIDIRAYNQVVDFNEKTGLITVQAGITLKDLVETVEKANWCIPCLPDINTVTLSGALATGTHGTSGKLLAEYMVACRLILANGEIEEITETHALLDAVRVSLGLLGVMSTISLQCVPKYTLHVSEGPQKDEDWLRTCIDNFAQKDFYRILWLPHTGYGYVIEGHKIDPATPVTPVHGPTYLKHRRTVSKLLYRWTNRFPKLTAWANKLLFYLFFNIHKEDKGSLYEATVTKSRGATLELAEWTIAADKFETVFRELKTTLNSWKNNAFVHIPMDIRFVQEDKSWLSYAYGTPAITVGCVTRNAATADQYAAFAVVEEIFLKHGGRPHWGKRFQAKDNTLRQLYPKWDDFKRLRKKLDPTNKFLNTYLKELLHETDQ